MSLTRTRFLGVLFLLLALRAPGGATPAWLSTVDEGLARARAEKKLVFLEIVSKRNPASLQRDDSFYHDARLLAALASFVPVRLNADAAGDTVRKWDPAGFPTLLVLQAEGKEIARPPGTLDAAALAARLEKIYADERDLARLRETLTRHPEDATAQLAAARIYLRRGDAAAAQPLIESLSGSTNPEARQALPSLWLGLGLALGKGGPSPKGKELFERVARDYPDTREAEQANYLLAVILSMQGDRQAAARAYRRVLDTSSDEYLRERAERALRRIPPAQ